MAGVLVEIWDEHCPNASVQPYRCVNLFCTCRLKEKLCVRKPIIRNRNCSVVVLLTVICIY
jgi:hypothetical protein